MHGKTALLFKLPATALAPADETVRNAVFPVVNEKTLRQLVRETKPARPCFRAKSGRCCVVRIRITIGGCCRRSETEIGEAMTIISAFAQLERDQPRARRP